MKNSAILVLGLLVSVSAFANSSGDFDYSQSNSSMKKLHTCIKGGWAASKPTDQQESDSKAFIQAARDSWEQNKEAVISAKKDLIAAWSAYPIVAEHVATAETDFQTALAPVKTAMRTSLIGVLNLLSNDQRKAFDQSFMSCMKKDDTQKLFN
jgi:hypothetical protein